MHISLSSPTLQRIILRLTQEKGVCYDDETGISSVLCRTGIARHLKLDIFARAQEQTCHLVKADPGPLIHRQLPTGLPRLEIFPTGVFIELVAKMGNSRSL
jgi:hypothetical protein